MEYEKLCDEILECDKKIRYVGTYDYGELYDKMRSGLKSHLSKEETELSLSQAIYRWSTRKKTAEKIGKPVFALAKYEKIYLIFLSHSKISSQSFSYSIFFTTEVQLLQEVYLKWYKSPM